MSINHKGYTVQTDYNVTTHELQVDLYENGWVIDSIGLETSPTKTLFDHIDVMAAKHNLTRRDDDPEWEIETTVEDGGHVVTTSQLYEA